MNTINKTSCKFFIAMLFFLCIATTKANNLSISDLMASNQGAYYNISFIISWDNSWYTTTGVPYNWDAVWVFVKYKNCGTTNWVHADLNTTGNSVGGGVLTIENPAYADAKGLFVRRAATGGPGSISPVTVTLELTNPVPAGGPYNFQVYGIEMVRIIAEDFQIGDATSTSTFTSRTVTTAEEAAGVAANWTLGTSPAVPAAYPMGWDAFYCMKYEITQEQYVDFLNSLTYNQQVNRTAISPNASATNYAMYSSPTILYRNGIKVKTSGIASTTPAEYACDFNGNNIYNETGDGQNIAMNYLSWYDFCAYLDWAALRPMSDLEFEKICRGPTARVAGEYPWGSTAIMTSAGISNSGFNNEVSTSSGNGLCNYTGSSLTAPYRIGFAATASTTRAGAGASYYGAMEMGGNVWERVVSVLGTGAGSGTAFLGTLGDGALDASGNADVADWPTNAVNSSGYRGGYFSSASTLVRLSDRSNAANADVTRTNAFGGRGVR